MSVMNPITAKKDIIALAIIAASLAVTGCIVMSDDLSVYAVSNEAQIGATGYATLEEAYAAASNEDTIELMTDVVLDKTLVITKNITLKGNHTITGKSDGTFYEKVGGKEYRGLISLDAPSGVDSLKFVLDGPTIDGSGKYRGIDCILATIEMKSGKITNCYSYEYGKDAGNGSGLWASQNTKFTMTGGEITGNVSGNLDIRYQCSADAFFGAAATVNINGGKMGKMFANSGEHEVSPGVKIKIRSNVTVDGGSVDTIFLSYIKESGAQLVFNSGTISELRAGTSSSDAKENFLLTPEVGQTYLGGSLSNDAAEAKVNGTDFYYKFTEAVDAAPAGAMITLLKDIALDKTLVITKSVTLNGGKKITGKSDGTFYEKVGGKEYRGLISLDAPSGVDSLKFVLDGPTIDGSGKFRGINCILATIEMKSGKITNCYSYSSTPKDSGNGSGLWASQNTKFTMIGGEITGNVSGNPDIRYQCSADCFFGSASKVTIEGGHIGNMFCNAGDGSYYSVTTVKGTAVVDTAFLAYYKNAKADKPYGAEMTIEGGQVTNLRIGISSNANGDENYLLTPVPPGTYKGGIEAKIGEKIYQTLHEAYNAASDGDNIELLRNIIIPESLVIKKSIKLSGAFKITPADNDSKFINTNDRMAMIFIDNRPKTNDASALEVTISDIILDGNGKYRGITNRNATLIMESGTVVTNCYSAGKNNYGCGVCITDKGKFVMTGGTIKDNKSDNLDGYYAYNTDLWCGSETESVISGDAFVGKMRVMAKAVTDSNPDWTVYSAGKLRMTGGEISEICLDAAYDANHNPKAQRAELKFEGGKIDKISLAYLDHSNVKPADLYTLTGLEIEHKIYWGGVNTVTWMDGSTIFGTSQVQYMEVPVDPTTSSSAPSKAPTDYEKYAFVGWNTDPNAVTQLNLEQQTLEDNITYYAIYEVTQFSISAPELIGITSATYAIDDSNAVTWDGSKFWVQNGSRVDISFQTDDDRIIVDLDGSIVTYDKSKVDYTFEKVDNAYVFIVHTVKDSQPLDEVVKISANLTNVTARYSIDNEPYVNWDGTEFNVHKGANVTLEFSSKGTKITYADNNDASVTVASNTAEYSFVADTNHDLTVSSNAVKIFFDANGGLVNGKPSYTIEIASGAPIGELPVPEYDGHEFVGWYEATGNSITKDTAFQQDTTVVAKWNAVSDVDVPPQPVHWIWIKFDVMGGSSKHDSRYIVAGSSLSRLPVPEYDGHEFAGWYNEKGNKVSNNTVFFRDTTLYARWVAISDVEPSPQPQSFIRIDFHVMGGSSTHDPVYIVTGSSLSDLPEATHDEHIFGGWHNEHGHLISEHTVFHEDTTIYAKWVISYTDIDVVFDANGGLVNGQSTHLMVIRDNAPLGELPVPVHDRHSFVGWYTALEGGMEVNSETVLNHNSTLYALWESEVGGSEDNTAMYAAGIGAFALLGLLAYALIRRYIS